MHHNLEKLQEIARSLETGTDWEAAVQDIRDCVTEMDVFIQAIEREVETTHQSNLKQAAELIIEYEKLAQCEAGAAVMRQALVYLKSQIEPNSATYGKANSELRRTFDHLMWHIEESLAQDAGRDTYAALNRIEALCRDNEQGKPGISSYGTSDISKRVDWLLREYERTATNALAGAKSFQEDMLTWLRGLSIAADMVGNGSTHAEKNARMRGLLEIIESAIQKVQEARIDFSYNWYTHHDVFRSDYPTRHFVSRIHELESEVNRLKREAGEEVTERVRQGETPF